MNKFQVSALAREAKEMQGVRAKKEEKPAEGMIWVMITIEMNLLSNTSTLHSLTLARWFFTFYKPVS